MATIVPIAGDSARRICAGQVIVGLKSCVKELVDNSLDAEISLVEGGARCVEVVDDGCGISRDNLTKIGQQHNTSKIRTFEDINVFLPTFGFRGEALSSLCATGEVCISTRTAEDTLGARVVYGAFGETLTVDESVPREVGTSISVENLFSRFPVRRREFLQSLKLQLSLTTQLLTAYSIAQSDVRFLFQVEDPESLHSRRCKTILSSDGTRKSLKEAVGLVFGHSSVIDMEDFMIENREGQWSACHRRQKRIRLFFINKRPIEAGMNKIISGMTSIYKTMTSGNSPPQFVLTLQTKANLIDYNVTPDKCSVFVKNEDEITQLLVSHIADRFGGRMSSLFPSQFDSNTLLTRRLSQGYPHEPTFRSGQKPAIDITDVLEEGSTDNSANCPQRVMKTEKLFRTNDERVQPLSSTNISDGFIGGMPRACNLKRLHSMDPGFEVKEWRLLDEELPTMGSQLENITRRPTKKQRHEVSCISAATFSPLKKSKKEAGRPLGRFDGLTKELVSQSTSPNGRSSFEPFQDISHFPCQEDEASTNIAPICSEGGQSLSQEQSPATGIKYSDSSEIAADGRNIEVNTSPIGSPPLSSKCKSTYFDGPVRKITLQGIKKVSEDVAFEAQKGANNFAALFGGSPLENYSSLDVIFESSRQVKEVRNGVQLKKRPPLATYQSTLVNIDRNRTWRNESKVIISKSKLNVSECPTDGFNFSLLQLNMEPLKIKKLNFPKTYFNRIQIIGQFNKGFILAALRTKSTIEIFIIDQHATDEKAKFEKLLGSYYVSSQPLISPLELELSPIEKHIISQHLKMFAFNGFDIEVEGTRYVLKSLPWLGGETLTLTDLYELVDNMSTANTQSSDQVIRPSRIKKFFASRLLEQPKQNSFSISACRSAVMIGKALSRSRMSQIVQLMSTLKQPWNCPHGRPTMRHLISIS